MASVASPEPAANAATLQLVTERLIVLGTPGSRLQPDESFVDFATELVPDDDEPIINRQQVFLERLPPDPALRYNNLYRHGAQLLIGAACDEFVRLPRPKKGGWQPLPIQHAARVMLYTSGTFNTVEVDRATGTMVGERGDGRTENALQNIIGTFAEDDEAWRRLHPCLIGLSAALGRLTLPEETEILPDSRPMLERQVQFFSSTLRVKIISTANTEQLTVSEAQQEIAKLLVFCRAQPQKVTDHRSQHISVVWEYCKGETGSSVVNHRGEAVDKITIRTGLRALYSVLQGSPAAKRVCESLLDRGYTLIPLGEKGSQQNKRLSFWRPERGLREMYRLERQASPTSPLGQLVCAVFENREIASFQQLAHEAAEAVRQQDDPQSLAHLEAIASKPQALLFRKLRRNFRAGDIFFLEGFELFGEMADEYVKAGLVAGANRYDRQTAAARYGLLVGGFFHENEIAAATGKDVKLIKSLPVHMVSSLLVKANREQFAQWRQRLGYKPESKPVFVSDEAVLERLVRAAGGDASEAAAMAAHFGLQPPQGNMPDDANFRNLLIRVRHHVEAYERVCRRTGALHGPYPLEWQLLYMLVGNPRNTTAARPYAKLPFNRLPPTISPQNADVRLRKLCRNLVDFCSGRGDASLRKIKRSDGLTLQ